MFKLQILPIEWKGWDLPDTNVITLYNAKFTEKFGKFTKGEKFSILTVSYEKGFVEAYAEDGVGVVKYQRFTAIPKD